MMQHIIPSKRRFILGMGGLTGIFLPLRLKAGAKTDPRYPVEIKQIPHTSHEAFIRRAFEMRELAVEMGDQPYGAIVVRDSKIIGQSPSHVVVHHDPTAHAELEAIRDAARRTGSRDLRGCILYSSSPACPMCEAGAYWANIERMVAGREARDNGRPALC